MQLLWVVNINRRIVRALVLGFFKTSGIYVWPYTLGFVPGYPARFFLPKEDLEDCWCSRTACHVCVIVPTCLDVEHYGVRVSADAHAKAMTEDAIVHY